MEEEARQGRIPPSRTMQSRNRSIQPHNLWVPGTLLIILTRHGGQHGAQHDVGVMSRSPGLKERINPG